MDLPLTHCQTLPSFFLFCCGTKIILQVYSFHSPLTIYASLVIAISLLWASHLRQLQKNSGRRRRHRLAVSINTQGWHGWYPGLCHSGLQWQAAGTQSWCCDSRKEIPGTGWPLSAQAWWDKRKPLHWCQSSQLWDRGCHSLVNHVLNRTLEKQSSTSEEAALFKNNMWYILLVWMLWGYVCYSIPLLFLCNIYWLFSLSKHQNDSHEKASQFFSIKKESRL